MGEKHKNLILTLCIGSRPTCSLNIGICYWKKSLGDLNSTSFILLFGLLAVAQVESMNIHELPWHINKMNYAARFMVPNPHVQANNSRRHPLRVLCHHHAWQTGHDPTWPWHWPMGDQKADRYVTFDLPLKGKCRPLNRYDICFPSRQRIKQRKEHVKLT